LPVKSQSLKQRNFVLFEFADEGLKETIRDPKGKDGNIRTMETEILEAEPAPLEQLLETLEQNGYNTIPALKVYLVASEFIRNYDVLTELAILDRFCR